MERPPLELGDLVEHWTLVGNERDLVAAKNYDTQLGFALLLKFYGRFGRFPRGRSKLHEDAVEFVARQLGVSAGSVGFYEWSGRTVKRHRAEIRAHFGFRECTVADADELAGWLAGGYAQEERRYELVRDEVLAECRSRSIEPPTPDRVERILRSGLHQAEKILTARIWARLPAEVRARLLALVSADAGEGGPARPGPPPRPSAAVPERHGRGPAGRVPSAARAGTGTPARPAAPAECPALP